MYKAGDWRMGAKILATAAPVGPQVAGYDRLGGSKDADTFLETWWNPNEKPETWKWPAQDGFKIVNGHAVKRISTLKVGTRIDRYGGETGNFFAPEGASYTSRALPPANLSNVESCNYHIYEVIKPMKVYRGPIAPWFGQRGGATQFQASPVLIDPASADCGTKLNVEWLSCAKYLKAVYP
ncbi:TNT domain-containing protein [Gordonia asplenii]|uniref:TNT domain-containing protein n=1 Tax=Gordonia asplenii TaxID=2725283 RepID=UPI001FE46F0D|nr:TNT domain-containing protein [Gordonia asplenii]